VLFRTPGRPYPVGWDHGNEHAMAQPPTNPTQGPIEQGDHRIPAQGAEDPAAGPQWRVRTHVLGQVVVLEVVGRLSDVVADLDLAIRLALADRPRGVVCDLTAACELEEARPAAVKVLARTGRHVRDWPAIPLAVACPNPWVREALSAHPLGGNLIVTPSMLSAVSAVLATPTPTVKNLRLAPHPTAPHAARNFVTRTLLGWGLSNVIPWASLVVSELVTNSSTHTDTDIDLSVARHLGSVRLTVRDHSPDRPHQRPAAQDLHGRGLAIITSLSRAFGVLPTTDGGKVVWAVLDATRPQPSSSPSGSDPATKDSSQPSIPPSRPELGGHHAFAQHGPPHPTIPARRSS